MSWASAAKRTSGRAEYFAALSTARAYVTQNFVIGALLTLDDEGEILVSNPARSGVALDVVIQRIDAARQSVTLENNGSGEADLSGCILFSARSGAALRFPNDTILSSGQSLVVGSGGTFVFPDEDAPLSKKKTNTVTLFDSLGTRLSQYEQ